MKRGGWLASGVAALALLGWLVWLRPADPAETPWSATASSTAPASIGNSTRREVASDDPPKLGGEYFTLDAVTRASQLEGPEARRLLTEADRLDLLLTAQILCNAAEKQRKFGNLQAMPEGRRGSWEFRLAFAKDFCDPALPHYTAYAARLAELDIRDDTAVAMGLGLLKGTDIEAVGVPTARRLIRESASMGAVVRASDFLLASGHDLPQADGLPFPPGMDNDPWGRRISQRLAITMVGCRVRGGCGARGLQTMAWCDRCGPSVTLEQMWRRQHPPDIVAFARTLAARIEAERQQAAAP